MSTLLDNAFCDYAIQNNLVRDNLVADLKNKKDLITLRETLLALGYISFEKYKNILVHLQDSKLLDSNLSKAHDKKFVEYGCKKGWLTKEDISQCQGEYFSSSFSIRELLLISERIPYEIYRDIMNGLQKTAMDDEKSALGETIIDAHFPTGHSDESVMIVEENAIAETIIDINPLEGGLGKPSFANAFSPASSSSLVISVSPSASEVTAGETLIDQEIQPFARSKEHLAETKALDARSQSLPQLNKIISKPTKNLEDTVDLEYQETAAPKLPPAKPDKKAASNIGAETTKKVEKNSPASLVKSDKASGTKSAVTKIAQSAARTNNKQQEIQDNYTVPAALIETLIKEISKEVNLQTQQASQSLGQSLKGYKLLLGFTVFMSIFVLIFTGSIEWQRAMELKSLRSEKNNEMKKLEEEKQFLTQTKQLLELERDKQRQTAQNLEKQLEDLGKEKNQIQEKVESLEKKSQDKEMLNQQVELLKQQTLAYQKNLLNSYEKLLMANYQQKRYQEALENIEKANSLIGQLGDKDEEAKFEAYAGLVYQGMNDLDKASQKAQKAWATGKKNGEVLLVLADYFIAKQSAKANQEALRLLQTATSLNFPELWKAHMKLGDLSYQQGKYVSARESWEIAAKLHPAIQKETQEKIAKISKHQ